MLKLIYLLIFIVFSSVLYFIILKKKRHSIVEKFIFIALTSLSLLVATSRISQQVTLKYEEMNGARITPSLAIVKGLKIYHEAGETPFMSTVYGPVSYVPYIPASAFFSTPNSIIYAGSLTTLLLIFIPFSLIISLFIRKYNLSDYFFPILSFLLLMLSLIPSSGVSIYIIHSDGPAIGFFLFALYFTLKINPENFKLKKIILPALFSALSIWSKQSFVFIALVQFILLWRNLNFKRAFLYGLFTTIFGFIILGIILIFISYKALFYNMFEIFSKQEWAIPKEFGKQTAVVKFKFLIKTIYDDILVGRFPVIFYSLIAISIIYIKEGWKYLIDVIGFKFLVITIIATPFGLLGYLKIGGWINNFTVIDLFLLISVTFLTIELFNLLKILGKFTLVFTLIIFLIISNYFISITQIINNLSSHTDSPQEIVFRYSKKHPQELYFPYYSLPVLLVENKLYNFDYAVYDIVLGKRTIHKQLIEKGSPNFCKTIIYRKDQLTKFILKKYYPEYIEIHENNELPGFRIFSKKE